MNSYAKNEQLKAKVKLFLAQNTYCYCKEALFKVNGRLLNFYVVIQ